MGILDRHVDTAHRILKFDFVGMKGLEFFDDPFRWDGGGAKDQLNLVDVHGFPFWWVQKRLWRVLGDVHKRVSEAWPELCVSGTWRAGKSKTLSPSPVWEETMELRIAGKRVAVVDVETTGLSSDDEIIEIAIVWPEEGVVFDSLVRPSGPILNSDIHGITDEDVADAPSLDEIAGEIVERLRDRVVAGHNVSFDLKFLQPVLTKAGFDPAIPNVCTLDLYRYRFGGPAKLAVAAEHLGIDLQGSHRAGADAWTAAHLLKALMPRMGELEAGEQSSVTSRILRNLGRSWRPKPAWSDPEVEATRLTAAAQKSWAEMGQVLAYTLDVHDALDWEALKERPEFKEAPPAEIAEPELPVMALMRGEPEVDDPEFQAPVSFGRRVIELILPWLRQRRENAQRARFERALAEFRAEQDKAQEAHEQAVLDAETEFQRAVKTRDRAFKSWSKRRAAFFAEHDRLVENIEKARISYEAGEQLGVETMFGLVFQHSYYPEFFPEAWEVEYDAERRHVRVHKRLPVPGDLPRVKEFKWQKNLAAFKATEFSKSAVNGAYDELVLQVLLRTIHEIEESDVQRHVLTAEIIGYVEFLDPATGLDTRRDVALVEAELEAFRMFNLAQIDTRECFKGLKGRPKNAKFSALNSI